MRYLLQFLVIIGFSFLGEVLHYCIPLPVPTSIYGIVLLFTALELRWVKVRDIREASSFLIAIMPIMFVPSAAGLVDSWSVIGQSWLKYIVVIVVSTFVVMAVAGWTTQYIILKNKRNR